MANAMQLHPSDDVAVVLKAISKGEDAAYVSGGREVSIKAADDIPIYHKIAVRSVNKGSPVLKYGEVIGYATADIRTGYHVHTHNLSDLVDQAGVSV